jgi:Transposase IS116/IS110/IS902 family
MAQLARGRARAKITALQHALEGAEFFTPEHAALLAAMLARIGGMDAQIARLTLVIDRLLAPHEEHLEQAESMPGWGRLAAQDARAETGPDMTRFPTGGHLASWAGRVPLDRQSGKRTGRARESAGTSTSARSPARPPPPLGAPRPARAPATASSPAAAARQKPASRSAAPRCAPTTSCCPPPACATKTSGPTTTTAAATTTARSATSSASSAPRLRSHPLPPSPARRTRPPAHHDCLITPAHTQPAHKGAVGPRVDCLWHQRTRIGRKPLAAHNHLGSAQNSRSAGWPRGRTAVGWSPASAAG